MRSPMSLRVRFLAVAFVAFRLFDITKPWPIRKFEKLPGGWGVMADDLVAAFYAYALILPLVLYMGS